MLQDLGNRSPENIPVAGVSLRELLGEPVSCDWLLLQVPEQVHQQVKSQLKDGDEVRPFRTPLWTWQAMGGIEGYVVLRNGLAVFWIVTRRN